MDTDTVNVVVVQRQTLDWHSLSMPEFREQSRPFCRLWHKPEDYIYRLAELWNTAFSLDYLNTRALLKDIAMRNVGGISGIKVIPYAQYSNVPDCHGFYVPMDDDDWLSPTIGEVLAQCDPAQHSLLLWRSVNIGSPQQEHPVFIWGLNGRCMTNNYAASSVWMQNLKYWPNVIQHKDAWEVLQKLHRDNVNIVQLDAALTVSNKSPISSVSLDNGVAGNFCPARLVALVENYLEKMNKITATDIAWIPWVTTPLEETVALFHRVLDSQK